jgi:hypothetical protein
VTKDGTSLCGWDGVEDVPEEASRGGRGRKLQEPEGRWETRVKISDMRRCWTDVSCIVVSG